jgi:hypothetical protein
MSSVRHRAVPDKGWVWGIIGGALTILFGVVVARSPKPPRLPQTIYIRDKLGHVGPCLVWRGGPCRSVTPAG